jgi:hypothetical protein
MIHKRVYLFGIALVAGMVMAATAHAFVPTEVGVGAALAGQGVISKEIDIEPIRDIDVEMLDLMDTDSDGSVSLDEFMHTGGSDILFRIADADKDHLLTALDLSPFTVSVQPEYGDEPVLLEECKWYKGVYYCLKCAWVYYLGEWRYICWWEEQ